MDILFESAGYAILGYLCGSLSFALWITRALKGVDLRDCGSGHATATNTIRTAGWTAGIIVLVLDLLKGFLPTWLASRNANEPWIVALAAGMTIVGHCWTLFAGFRGGMGLAAAGGAFLAVSPLGFLIGLGILIALALILHHSARAAVLTGPLLPVIFYLIGLRGTIIWISLSVGLVISLRFLIDWNREYRELWLDRETNPY